MQKVTDADSDKNPLRFAMTIETGSGDPRPGRTCPLHYRYGAASLRREADLRADTLYVIGGMYGNQHALDAILRLHAVEPDAVLVFNGDFNWFNVDDESFLRVSEEVLRHRAIRGNVETELLSGDAAAGCGCGYPDYVNDDDVVRSNLIMARLAGTARRHRTVSGQLAALPMNLVANVGGLGIGIVHGDGESLAGWSFGEEAIDPAVVGRMFDAAAVRVFASSHTCLPVAQVFELARGASVLINNGAAGMPNFAGTRSGVLSRISIGPAPAGVRVLYGTVIEGVHIDAVPIDYDHAAWLAHFDAVWPAGSAAALSYRGRIVHGPAYPATRAIRAGIRDRQSAVVETTYGGAVIELAA